MSSTTYSSSGNYTYDIPSGADELIIECWGAGGADGAQGYRNSSGDVGGYIRASVMVSDLANSSLEVYVGGEADKGDFSSAGGYNGGGDGASDASGYGGGGGGGSDVRDGTTQDDRIVVAGGGGGGATVNDTIGWDWSMGNGGAGGANTGQSGGTVQGGGGGTQTSGGGGGYNANDGAFHNGGNGGAWTGASGEEANGGGAGGGWYGGGGGGASGADDAVGGGGGGSNYAADVTTIEENTQGGGNAGDGQVTITVVEALDTPQNVQINDVQEDEITLQWDAVTDAEEYNVYRHDEPDPYTNGSVVASVADDGSDPVIYTDTGLTANKEYYYQITADSSDDSLNESDPSAEVTDRTDPLVTFDDVAIQSVREVDVLWTIEVADTDIDATHVERADDNNGSPGTWEEIATLTNNEESYTDTDVLDGERYHYRVYGENSVGPEVIHNPIYIPPTPIPPVENITVDSVSGRSATVSWDDPSNNALGQRVYRRRPVERSYTQDNQSFDDDYPKWTVNNGGRVTDYVWEGTYSFYSSADDTGMQASRTYFPGGEQPSTFTYYYRETSNSTGGGVRLVNSNGNYEGGTATDNDEYEVDFANTTGLVHDPAHGYGLWVRVTWDFDWANGTVTVAFEQPDGTSHYSNTYTLKQGVDVETVELWNYNGGTWGSHNLDMWWDGLYFGGSIPYTTTELLDGQRYAVAIETFTKEASIRTSGIDVGSGSTLSIASGETEEDLSPVEVQGTVSNSGTFKNE